MSRRVASLDIKIGADIAEMKRGIREVESSFKQFNQRLDGMGQDMFRSAAKAALAYVSVTKGISLIQNITQVRADRQLLESSFEVLLKSAERAKNMIGEMTELSTKSPIELGQIAKAAQTLLGYGVAGENVTEILRQLGDISMGNADRFQSLALAFAQMHSTGRLVGQDLLQMINAGFNPLMVISEKTGKSIGELREEMSKGAISAEQVAEAFASATSEGGLFYGMTEKQSSGIQGLMSQYRNAVTEAYNEIGKSQEGVIGGVIKFATAVVKNYEPIVKAIGLIVVAYGSYKAVIIATNAVQGVTLIVKQTVEYLKMARALGVATANQVAFNTAVKVNPIGLIISVLATAAAAIYLFSSRTKQASEASQALARVTKSTTEEIDKESAKVNALHAIMTNAQVSYNQRLEALNELKRIIPSYTAELTKEGEVINDNTTAIKEYLVQLEKQIKLKAAQEELEEAFRKKRELERNKVTAESNLKDADPTPFPGFFNPFKENSLATPVELARIELRAIEDALTDTQDSISALGEEIQKTSLSVDSFGSSVGAVVENVANASSSTNSFSGLISKLTAELNAFEEQKKRATSVEEISLLNTKINELKGRIEGLNSVTSEFLEKREKWSATFAALANLNLKPIEITAPVVVRPEFDFRPEEISEQWQDTMGNIAEIMAAYTKEFIVTIASGIGEIAAGDLGLDGLLWKIIGLFGNFIRDIGVQLLALGSLIEMFRAALATVLESPGLAIAVGIAMIAIGSAMAAFANKKSQKSVPKLAKGGLAYGPTYAVVGDNPRASVDPEVIAPLSKLKSMMTGSAGGMNIRLGGEFRIKGRELVLAIGKENYKLDIIK